MMLGPGQDARFQGAAVETRIVAAVRCTEIGTGTFDGKQVGMLIGTLVGESAPKVLFPGEVPAEPPPPEHWASNPPDYPEFCPPRIDPAPLAGIPQIGLDAALDYLVGDRFA
jgi:predicted YcjX-like family ATPase